MNITVGKITLVPLDPSYQIRIDRTTILGNPFFLPTDANVEEREFVLKIYRTYLDLVIRKDCEPTSAAKALAKSIDFTIPNSWQRPSRKAFMDEFDRLGELAQKQRIELMCFCHPKRCHGDILKAAIEWKAKN